MATAVAIRVSSTGPSRSLRNVMVARSIPCGRQQEDLRKLSEAVQGILGFESYRVQCGLEPKDWKPMTSIGTGVKEIRTRDEAGHFRMIYLATRPEGVYVLPCFQKKTQRTGRSDLKLATKRLKSIAR